MSYYGHSGRGHIVNGRDFHGPLHFHESPSPPEMHYYEAPLSHEVHFHEAPIPQTVYVEAPVYVHDLPVQQPPYQPGHGGGAGPAIGFAIATLLVVAGGVFIYRWHDTNNDQPSSTGPSAVQTSRTTGGKQTTRKAASTYPIRITYQHWYQFIPQRVDVHKGDSLRFTNASGRSCHLIADSGYLPSGTGDNPMPDGGSYTVRYRVAERGFQGIRCEEETGPGLTVTIPG